MNPEYSPIPTQTAYLLAIGFDLLTDNIKDQAFNELVKLIKKSKEHLGTGFLGTPLLCPTLDKYGKIDLAYSVLLKETYPSWIYTINNGATTMWERWNSYSKKKGYGPAGMNSIGYSSPSGARE